MAGRKILMNVAVELGAATGKKFIYYVDWLVENQYVTPPMRDRVDEIRELGPDELLTFVEMLLRIVWEYPERGRRAKAGRKARDGAPVMQEPRRGDRLTLGAPLRSDLA